MAHVVLWSGYISALDIPQSFSTGKKKFQSVPINYAAWAAFFTSKQVNTARGITFFARRGNPISQKHFPYFLVEHAVE